jgi:LuxR family maltose regulon positive regulatory protein
MLEGPPLIAQTKIHIPHIKKTLVSRPRLMNKLDEGMETKLTLVSAQAGYGKTTALAEWTKQCDGLVAWLSLDKLDNDWSTFWRCFIASIQKKDPKFGHTLDFLIEQQSATSYESAMTALINELVRIDSQVVIIIDDFHFIELPSIHHSLSHLLYHFPAHVHLYIASRSDLPIPTARLLAKGEMNKISMQDLQFAYNEGIVFLRDIIGLPLTKEQAEELFRQTEGWVSGLQLAAIALKQSDNIARSIHQFNGRQRHISDYLLEEVLQQQPKDLRDFLLATSGLSRMNKELCLAVTGESDSQARLEQLDQLNLFMIPMDENRDWYRYHHLLSDFLQRVAAEENPDRLLQAHIRAARWLENYGYYDEAVEHYIKGSQVEGAVRLIEAHLFRFVQMNRSLIMRWLIALPESSYENKPLLETYYISMLVVQGKWEKAFQRAKQAEARFEALRDKLPAPEWNRAMGDLYFFCGIISYLQQDLPKASYSFELLERFLPEGSSFQDPGGKRYEGYDHFTDLLSLNNDLEVVEQFLLKWINTWKHKKHYTFIGFQYVTYIMLLHESNRLEEAELHVRQALAREDLRSVTWFSVQLNILSARLLQASGHYNQAADVLAQLKLSIDSPDYELILRKVEAEEAHLLLRQDKLQEATDWLGRCDLLQEDEVFPLRLEEYVALIKVLAATGNTEKAIQVIERLNRLPDQDKRIRDCIKLWIVQSIVLYKAGRTQAAYAALESALPLAEPVGYVRSFVDEGPAMAEMLAGFIKTQQQSGKSSASIDYAKRILNAMNVANNHETMPSELLTDQETMVLLLIAEGMVNKEIAHRLYITPETVKFHIKNVYRKLGAHNRVQALHCAYQLQLIPK